MWKAEKFCAHSGQYNDGYEHQYEDSWSIEHISTDANGIKLKLTRYQYSLNWETPALYARFTLGETTVKSDSISAYISEGFQRSRTSTVNITVPNEWAAKTINWTIGGYSGTLLFDCYGQFEFTVRADIHAPVRVERTASPKAEAKTGILNNKAAVYTGDELTVTFSVDAGYEGSATLNGDDITTGHSLTVGGSIAVITAASPKATIHLFLGGWTTYMFRVYEGSDWGLYQAVIYNGSEWERYY